MDEAGRKVNIRRECIGDCDLTEKEYCRKPSGNGRIANLKRAGYDVAWSVLSMYRENGSRSFGDIDRSKRRRYGA